MKRSVLFGAGLGVLATLAIPLANRLSPWPSALLIKKLFAQGDAENSERLVKHLPQEVQVIRNIAYGQDRDERMDIYRPAHTASALPTVIWAHGGGWIGGSRHAVGNWLRILAHHGYATVAVGYSTARKDARYPTPVRQLNRALAYLHEQADALGLDRQRFILGGSSAGAQISAQLALLGGSASYARRVGIRPTPVVRDIRGIVLLSGAFDISGVGSNWFVNSLLWAYTGRRDFRRDPKLQLMAITPNVGAHFPPTYLTSGNADPLMPQARALAQRLQSLGVPTDALFFADDHQPSLLHEYQFNLDTAAGQLSQQRLLDFLARVSA